MKIKNKEPIVERPVNIEALKMTKKKSNMNEKLHVDKNNNYVYVSSNPRKLC